MIDDSLNVCEEKNYEALFYAHYEKLRNYLYYKYGDMSRAEDIVQESYAKLWQNCAKIIYTSAKSFLYKVANNATLNAIRDQKTGRKYTSDMHTTPMVASPEFELEEKEFGERLKIAIENLRSRHREAFLLHRIEKKTYIEIAEILDISVKAVEKRIHLALADLRNEIGQYKF